MLSFVGEVTAPVPVRDGKAETRGWQDKSSLKRTCCFLIYTTRCGIVKAMLDTELEDVDSCLWIFISSSFKEWV